LIAVILLSPLTIYSVVKYPFILTPFFLFCCFSRRVKLPWFSPLFFGTSTPPQLLSYLQPDSIPFLLTTAPSSLAPAPLLSFPWLGDVSLFLPDLVRPAGPNSVPFRESRSMTLLLLGVLIHTRPPPNSPLGFSRLRYRLFLRSQPSWTQRAIPPILPKCVERCSRVNRWALVSLRSLGSVTLAHPFDGDALAKVFV